MFVKSNHVLEFFWCKWYLIIYFSYIKMHVGFYNEKGILITCTLKTAEEYIKTSFIFDLIAVIPFDAIFISYHGNFLDILYSSNVFLSYRSSHYNPRP